MSEIITFPEPDTMSIDFAYAEHSTVLLEDDFDKRKIYIRNASGSDKLVIVQTVTSPDIFIMHCESLLIVGENIDSEIIGSIKVIGSIGYLAIKRLKVHSGVIGLHMSQHYGTEEYGSIEVKDCQFYGHQKEGVYIGKSDGDASAPAIGSILVENSIFTLNGWDGLQTGRSFQTNINQCIITGNALDRERYQDYDLTINPKSGLTYIDDCQIGSLQHLDSGRLFIKRTIIGG